MTRVLVSGSRPYLQVKQPNLDCVPTTRVRLATLLLVAGEGVNLMIFHDREIPRRPRPCVWEVGDNVRRCTDTTP
jgi:hypothetical protein